MRRRAVQEALSDSLLPPLVNVISDYNGYDEVFVTKWSLDLDTEDNKYLIAESSGKVYLLGTNTSKLYILKEGRIVRRRKLNICDVLGMIVHRQCLYLSAGSEIRLVSLSKRKRSHLKRWKIPHFEKVDLQGIALTPDKKIVVVDSANQVLHFFSTDGVYLDHWLINSIDKIFPPEIIAVFPKGEIAIGNAKEIVIYSPKGDREIKINTSCDRLSVSARGELYTFIPSSFFGKEIFVYTVGGRYLREFYLSDWPDVLQNPPRNILCLKNGQTLILDNNFDIHVFDYDLWDGEGLWWR